ncbi:MULTISPECIES: HigA family addiction module antitoxin [Metallibacterium]|jgi:addiction module HigA family antidote|uniref:HigA family addiction module antitoxin n=1 Tax=Metallibacterium TaxID=1218803 RepID=UPI002614F7D5|nr:MULTISPECIES: HigA family addiction module antitoxin [Metallibacterium]MBW8075037.1 HigA family addiction module antidote protein [Metallibacterium scheffleri]
MTASLPKNGMPPIHPGEFIQEILDDYGMSQAALARAIGVSPMRISHVVRGERPVTAELALRFGRAFGQSAQYWINLQNAYDLKIAEREIGSSLSKVRPLAA